jgi:hypothetical protein
MSAKAMEKKGPETTYRTWDRGEQHFVANGLRTSGRGSRRNLSQNHTTLLLEMEFHADIGVLAWGHRDRNIAERA